MSGLGSSGDTVITVVLTVMVAVLILVYLLNQWRIRKRDAHLGLESTQSVHERAYNQIKMARAGADHLAREGYDVASVRNSLSDAEAAQSRGNHAQALRLAESSRQRLVALREGRAAPGPATDEPSEPALPSAMAGASAAPVVPMATPATAARSKLPAHQVEARFEISVLRGELAAHRSPPGDGAAQREGEALAAQAQEAYDREQYSEAWRLALRGRRRLGATIEHVGRRGELPKPNGPVEAVSLSATPRLTPSGTGRCPQCGQPLRENDRFCRACGTTIGVAAACARCGAPKESDDRFCGTCGTPAAA